MSRSWIAGPKGLHMFKAFDVYCQIALQVAVLIYIPTNSVCMCPQTPAKCGYYYTFKSMPIW